MAGLIEGDGSFYVPKKPYYYKTVRKAGKAVTKKQKNYPIIKICFPKEDFPLAAKLQSIFGGVFEHSKKNTYVVLKFQSISSVYLVCRIINGYLRTPKQKKFESLLQFGNKNLRYGMKVSPIDSSDFSTNAWLTGFSEADSNFSIRITVRNKKTGNIRVQTTYRLEISTKINFKLNRFDNNVYQTKEFLTKICNFFGRAFYTRERFNKDWGKSYTSYIVIRFNQRSVQKVYNYFHKYPFKGSKYLNFMDWAKVVEMPALRAVLMQSIRPKP